MTDMEEKRIKAGSVTLTYLHYGNPQAPPVLFLHSLFMSAKDWNGVGSAFSEDYSVYALNLRGHATSDWPGRYSFDMMATDVVNFLNALKLRKVILIGHSLGGIVSYFVAAKHPERVSALVMEEAPPPKIGGGPFFFGERPVKKKLPYDWEVVKAIVDHLNHPDPEWWKLTGKITAPTLVIGGGPKSHVPQDWNAEIAAGIRNGRLVTLTGGHLVHGNHPKQFTEEVKRFLNDIKK